MRAASRQQQGAPADQDHQEQHGKRRRNQDDGTASCVGNGYVWAPQEARSSALHNLLLFFCAHVCTGVLASLLCQRASPVYSGLARAPVAPADPAALCCSSISPTKGLAELGRLDLGLGVIDPKAPCGLAAGRDFEFSGGATGGQYLDMEVEAEVSELV